MYHKFIPICRMDNCKRKRLEYTRRWKVAKRALNRPVAARDCVAEDSNEDSDHLYLDLAENSENDIMHQLCETESNDYLEHNEPEDTNSEREMWDAIDNSLVLSSDTDESENAEDATLASDLRKWVGKFGVRHNSVDDSLKILKNHGHNDLPSTARTLIGSIKHIDIENKSGMKYIYIGFKERLAKHISQTTALPDD